MERERSRVHEDGDDRRARVHVPADGRQDAATFTDHEAEAFHRRLSVPLWDSAQIAIVRTQAHAPVLGLHRLPIQLTAL